ncbi:MAG: beta-hexosaminidase [Firmicutes bacterium]|nr:beta-hexosaminidase [Bacillota bacterium]
MKKMKVLKMLRKPFAAAMTMVMILSCFTPIHADSTKTAEEIVAEMSLEQKIAQMIMPSFRYWTVDGKVVGFPELNDPVRECIKKHGFGGVIVFAENIQGTEQTVRLIDDMQRTSVSGGNLPLLIAADQEGGRVSRLATGTSMSGNMSLGALNDKNTAEEYARIMGSELNAVGINVDFAPVMDVNNNPANPVINIRSFSSDPQIAADMGEGFINGLHDEGVMTALKHFPGHGDTGTDSHTGLPCIDKSYDEIKNLELIPFKRGIDAGSEMIMTAHIQFPQIEKETYTSIKTGEKIALPATLSKTMITDVLRGDMGFDGIVVTDSLHMAAINENFKMEDTAKLAINAGVDMLLIPFYVMNEEDVAKIDDYINSIADMVKNGEINEDTITRSAERIVRLKLKKGLVEYNENVDEKVKNAKQILGCKAHHDKELEIAAKAITIVKNDNNVFPADLDENEKAVVFCYGDDYFPGVEYGENVLKDNGVIPENADIEVCSFYEAKFADYKDKVKDAKYMIIDDVMASLKNIDPNGDMAKFINEALSYAKENNIPSALMSMYMPYDVARYQNADAIFAVYSSKAMTEIPTELDGENSTYGPGYTAALCAAFGYIEPEGRLPVDIYELEDNSYSDKILYNIGYGLNYEKPIDESSTETTVEFTTESTTETTTKAAGSDSGPEKTTERKTKSSGDGKSSSKASSVKENDETKETKEGETEKAAESNTKETKEVILQIGNSKMTVNGKEVGLDAPPVIEENRTLVPIRAIIEALDGDVQWEGTSKTADITSGKGNKVTLTANSDMAYCDGKAKELDTKLVILNGRIMLPIRFVAENFGYSVDWNESEKIITIN